MQSGPQSEQKAIEEATLILVMMLLIAEDEWEKGKHWRLWRDEVSRQLK